MRSLLALAVFVGIAFAPHVAPAEIALRPGVSAQAGDEHVKSGIGITLQGGGGVTNFTGSGATAATDLGGYWDLRVVFGTRTFIGGELAYVGSSRGTTSASLYGSSTSLIGNGGEADVRFQLPLVSGGGALVEPFIFGGVGWSQYRYSNFQLGQSARSDNVGTVPFGGGLAFGYRGFMADARFTYRPTFDATSDFFGPSVSSGGLSSWTAGLMVGFEF
jgi:hypothetical protein